MRDDTIGVKGPPKKEEMIVFYWSIGDTIQQYCEFHDISREEKNHVHTLFGGLLSLPYPIFE
jgi:hypothetical protein